MTIKQIILGIEEGYERGTRWNRLAVTAIIFTCCVVRIRACTRAAASCNQECQSTGGTQEVPEAQEGAMVRRVLDYAYYAVSVGERGSWDIVSDASGDKGTSRRMCS